MTRWSEDGSNVCVSPPCPPRLRRRKTGGAVVHNELAEVFTAVFDEAVCYVENARFLITV